MKRPRGRPPTSPQDDSLIVEAYKTLLLYDIAPRRAATLVGRLAAHRWPESLRVVSESKPSEAPALIGAAILLEMLKAPRVGRDEMPLGVEAINKIWTKVYAREAAQWNRLYRESGMVPLDYDEMSRVAGVRIPKPRPPAPYEWVRQYWNWCEKFQMPKEGAPRWRRPRGKPRREEEIFISLGDDPLKPGEPWPRILR